MSEEKSTQQSDEKKNTADSTETEKSLLWFLGVITVVYFIFIAIAIAFFTLSQDSFEKPSSYAELGDLLAGVFAPLAFFWFIGAVIFQQRELAAMRQETARQADAAVLLAKHRGDALALEERQSTYDELRQAPENCKAMIERIAVKASWIKLSKNAHGNGIPFENGEAREPFTQHTDLYEIKGKETSIGMKLYYAVGYWRNNYEEEHGALWKCVIASNDADTVNSFVYELEVLDIWFRNMKAKAEKLNFQLFESQCIELGIYPVLNMKEFLNISRVAVVNVFDLPQKDPFQGTES